MKFYEPLESRQLFSTAYLADLHEVRVTGSDAADVVSVRVRGDWLVVVENGTTHRFALADVTTVGVQGGGGDDRIVMNAGVGVRGRLEGGDGNDWLAGGAGGDDLSGGEGDDVLLGGSGADTLNGGGGRDRLVGGRDDDHLDGAAGDDFLAGRAHDDTLTDGDGGNTLRGGRGRDVSHAIEGHSHLVGVEVNEWIDTRLPTLPGFPSDDITPLPGDPGEAQKPAAVTFALAEGYINTATVTLKVPAGVTVIWGDPRVAHRSSGADFTVEVAVEGAPGAGGTTVEVSRTFELGTLGLRDVRREYTFSVTSGGRTLAAATLTPQHTPPPQETYIPGGVSAGNADLTVRQEAGRVLADALLTFGSGGHDVAWGGKIERVGNEFFVDVSVDRWWGPATAAMYYPTHAFDLGEVGAGSYTVTLRSRAGVVATAHFTVA